MVLGVDWEKDCSRLLMSSLSSSFRVFQELLVVLGTKVPSCRSLYTDTSTSWHCCREHDKTTHCSFSWADAKKHICYLMLPGETRPSHKACTHYGHDVSSS